MILQTDSRLRKEINSHGCYFMSILFLINKYTGLQMSPDLIDKYFMSCVTLGYITNNSTYTAFIESAEGIFKHLGLNVRYTNTHEPPQRNCAKNEIEILCLRNCNGSKHFVVGDGKGHIAFNPMGISKGYKLHSKRIFKLL